MSKYVSIGKAAKILGVSPQTIRRWETEGRMELGERTRGGQRRYNILKLNSIVAETSKENLKTLCYARVSSHDQKDDLERQKSILKMYCLTKEWDFELISDLGSGMNYHKKGLRFLIAKIIDGEIKRLVITHKDRLLRFGAELVFALCEEKDVEVIIINKESAATYEEELAQDVLEIITVFSARLYGSRSHKNKKLIDNLNMAVKENS